MSSVKETALAGLIALGAISAFAYDYDVRMPTSAARPRWSGARVGEWTMDYKSAFAQAKDEGRNVLVFTTGSWWCPHCEAFEEKVLMSSEWNEYIQDGGFYLVMLDFPYRGQVTDDQLWKSKYPEYGDGWGFQCWLYDEDYLAENGLTKEQGLDAIMERYRVQKELALESASPVTIKSWDGSEEFTYGKVGYPTLIVMLPDGREAGRFSPSSTNREAEDARNYVFEKIDAILSAALDEDCGLCSEPEEWGLSGKVTQYYRGWLEQSGTGVVGTVEVTTGKKNRKNEIKITAKVKLAGKSVTYRGVGQDCCIESVTLTTGKKNSPELVLQINEDGMKGVYTDGEVSMSVTGARDVFKKSDADSKARAKLLTPGTWSLVMSPTETPSAYANGYGAFYVKVQKSGTVKFSGTLPDGKYISASSKAIIGDSDVYCVPIVIDTYSGKKGGFGCNLWFKNGWLFNVNAVRSWRSSGTRKFETSWRPIYSSVAGTGEIKEELELVFAEVPETIGGKPVISEPDYDTVTVRRNTWKGTEASNFKATLKSTGLLSGSMKFVLQRNAKYVTRKSCTVKGAVVDGTAYCTVNLGSDGSLPLKVSSCNACED